MKTTPISTTLLVSAIVLASSFHLHAQGTVTFNSPWASGGIAYATFYYDQSGMSIRVGDPTQPHDNMGHVGSVQTGHPGNGTPHMEFSSSLGIPQRVILAWTVTNPFGQLFTNGIPFGLISVDLADPVAPSLTPVDITFTGFKWDGSTVSQTFTVGGGGSTMFQTYQFNTDFALGLTRVEIPSAAWAMDNLIWIPEPSTASLFLVGLLALVHRPTDARR